MGGGSISKQTNTPEVTTMEKSQQFRKVKSKITNDSVDVIEVSNIALAIKNGEHINNVELTVGCRNLPAPKAFEEVHTMVVLYKSCPQLLQIGRTQIISNDLNPKFLTTFLLPSVSGNQQKIHFHIYNVVESSEELQNKKLIGTSQLNLQNLTYNDSNDEDITLVNSSAKEKSTIHISCCQYDGGGMQYEVKIEASAFTGKLQIYYMIEVQKDNDWIPVAKSKTIQIKKTTSFQLVKVSSHKFPGEETSRIRLRCYDVSKNQEELGFTDDIVLGALVSGQEKNNSKRIEKNGFVMGNLIIKEWNKVNRDSFLTYIVNGARLHLILGIDYTSSTFKGNEPLHHKDDDKNAYVMAIKEIVGILQYFDYYNQIALYGFGAKLPPYYKSVGQCFALNGNYFQPLIVGGVDKIIKKYRQNLAKIKPHGPSKLSQIINIAMKFAKSSEGLFTNYYVLVILTDGTVDDYINTKIKCIQASKFPLSIVLVCLGDGDFSQIKTLDQDDNNLLKHENLQSIRDMIDVIQFKDYLVEERTPLTEIHLARKTFAEIPAQFVKYMQDKGIRPNKEKKGIKTAKNDFISEKINAGKKKQNIPIIPEVQFLKDRKKQMIKELHALGIQPGKTFDQTLEISMDDLNYFIQIYSSKLPPQIKEEKPKHQVISSKQPKRFEEKLQKNEKLNNYRIQNQILKREANQTGKRQRMIQRAVEVVQKKQINLKHPCLKCKEKEICIVYGDCGHLAVCEDCQTPICIVCKEFNESFYNITDYQT